MYKSFKDMPVWQEAIEIAEYVFNFTNKLPRREDYGLTSQMRRSALSISANIAEAFGRKHTADKTKFYYYARGSIFETQSHLEYGHNIKYFEDDIYNDLNKKLDNIAKSLNKIIISLNDSK
ncbi:MAG TPA: four helix bundle protein [Candidatus Marinimicrobia bacterium]|nr:four helix bundle protein [Candidatus Neomarinimicrobiota bacterium]HRS51830.1 four helix bundle protein [Candidatus Neomarinimicrobiota bacterium]HRU92709.1 four helix bundle protein [Candidatus Neomarinimicrobiota bacterium]